MLHHAVSYDPTLRHIDLNGKVNDETVYRRYLTGNNMSTIHSYQIHKKGEERYDHKVNTDWFWYKRLYNTFNHKIDLEAQFEIGDEESDTEDARTKNTNIK